MSALSFSNSGPCASSASVRAFWARAQPRALSPVTSSSQAQGSAGGGSGAAGFRRSAGGGGLGHGGVLLVCGEGRNGEGGGRGDQARGGKRAAGGRQLGHATGSSNGGFIEPPTLPRRPLLERPLWERPLAAIARKARSHNGSRGP